ncbi:MAG: large subunit ribosomal protein L24 [Polaribacter sp.]|jgi:large subunit ribosomal protein L24
MAHKAKNVAPKKLHVKKGDKVMVIAGSSKGKTGEVLEVFPDKYRAVVEDVNIVKRHKKGTQEAAGGIVEMAAPIHISNLMLIDPKSGTPTKVGRKIVDGKSVRFSKKSGEILK